jgi:hypothetical protein
MLLIGPTAASATVGSLPGLGSASVDLLAGAARGVPTDPLSYLPTEAQSGPRGALDDATALRSAVAAGGYLKTVERLVPAGTTTPPLPAPSEADRALVSALPGALAAPVSGLYAAVSEAADMLGTIPVSELRSELQAAAALLDSYPERAAHAPGGYERRSYPGGPTMHVPGQLSHLSGVAFGSATTRAIDADPQAALLVAAALDRYVPQIRALRTTAPTGSTAASNGCDLVDETPQLCVASSGSDHTFTDDELMLVALGGDNTYLNGAGAAPFLPPGATQALPVSVNVDVGGGADRYAAPQSAIADPATGSPSLVMGQGAATFGGLGVSVNTSGDDSYAADGILPAPSAGTMTFSADLAAQGAGMGGYGLLFDGGGRDAFRTTLPRLTHAGTVFAVTQGASQGLADAVGALVDAGADATTYRVDAASDAGEDYAAIDVWAQGATEGEGTTALLYDGGGADSYAVTGTSSSEGLHKVAGFGGANYTVSAQGSANIGDAYLLEGQGAHSYSVDVTMNGGGDGLWGISGQGAADLASVAVLQDRGGPNTYDLQARMPVVRDIHVTDDCGCDRASYRVSGGAGDPGYQPVSGLDSDYLGIPLKLYGQGGALNGVAVLDNTGSATYRAVGTADMDINLHDDLSRPSAPALLDVHGFYGPMVIAQGAQELGYPDETPDEGMLINRSGTASYDFVTSNTVHATATSLHGPTPEVRARSGHQWTVAGQGAGAWSDVPSNGNLGAVLDLGGPGDRFLARQDTSVTTTPDSGHGIAPGGWWPPLQGAGDGGLVVALGPSPTFVSSPANGVCPGSPGLRGAGSWTSCGTDSYSRRLPIDPDHSTFDFIGGTYGTGRAAGFAPQATAASPQLTVAVPPTGADQSAVPVTASLADAAGRPVGGAPVTVSLVAEWPLAMNQAPDQPYADQWLTMAQTTLTTDADGVARGTLPVDLPSVTGYPPSQLVFDHYWVMATFAGRPGVTSRHTMADIALADGRPDPTVPEAPVTALLLGCGAAVAAGVFGWRRRCSSR